MQSFPHLADFRKGFHHIYFFKLIQAPQVVFLRGFFCFIVVIWTIYQKKYPFFKRFCP